jgi:hypothetical protein
VYLVTIYQPSQSKGKGAGVELIAIHQLLKSSGTVLKRKAQCCFIMLALNKRIKSFNLEVKVSGSALLIWAAKEEEESCSYSPFSIEVLTTKALWWVKDGYQIQPLLVGMDNKRGTWQLLTTS